MGIFDRKNKASKKVSKHNNLKAIEQITKKCSKNNLGIQSQEASKV